MTEQKPTIGRIVHYRAFDGREMAAIISFVHNYELVTLHIFDHTLPEPQLKGFCKIADTGGQCDRWFWPPRI